EALLRLSARGAEILCGSPDENVELRPGPPTPSARPLIALSSCFAMSAAEFRRSLLGVGIPAGHDAASAGRASRILALLVEFGRVAIPAAVRDSIGDDRAGFSCCSRLEAGGIALLPLASILFTSAAPALIVADWGINGR